MPAATGAFAEVPYAPDPLDAVRQRLSSLDERPVDEHPEQFADIDRLLRSALDSSDAANG